MRATARDCLRHQSARVVEQVPKVRLTRQHSKLRLHDSRQASRDIEYYVAFDEWKVRVAGLARRPLSSEAPLAERIRWGNILSHPWATRNQDALSTSLLDLSAIASASWAR